MFSDINLLSLNNIVVNKPISDKNKIVPIEVKSSNHNNHKSINEFEKKYSSCISRRIMFSQKDISNDNMLELKPIYLAPVIIKSFD